MMKLNVLLIASAITLAACDEYGYTRGVGFTGIDGEPGTIAESNAEQGLVSLALSSSAALAALPQINLQENNTSYDSMAQTAVRHGGRDISTALPVELAGQKQMLSMIQVNSVPFAVLRLPAGNPARLPDGTSVAFLSATPELTGCLLAQSQVYANGDLDRASGMAVPLNCS